MLPRGDLRKAAPPAANRSRIVGAQEKRLLPLEPVDVGRAPFMPPGVGIWFGKWSFGIFFFVRQVICIVYLNSLLAVFVESSVAADYYNHLVVYCRTATLV